MNNQDLIFQEQLDQLKLKNLALNTATLANIFELVSKTITNISDKDVSESLGKTLNKSVLLNLIANVIKEKLN